MRKLAFNRLEHGTNVIVGAIVVVDGAKVVRYYPFEREEADTTWVGGTARIAGDNGDMTLEMPEE